MKHHTETNILHGISNDPIIHFPRMPMLDLGTDSHEIMESALNT